MNIVRCAFVDENGVRCPATSGTPYADGWVNPYADGWGYLSALTPGVDVREGWYCRDHSRALEHDLHDDDKAA